MPSRILVTGSSGFIGSALTSALAAAGHTVRAASRQPMVERQENVEWAQLPDLESEIDWSSLVAGMDIVVHLAAIAHRGRDDSSDYERANRIATAELVKACRRQTIRRLIFMSSIGAQAGSEQTTLSPKPANRGPLLLTTAPSLQLKRRSGFRAYPLPF
jgi:nucleoside-diphosphate-sugar epimerase